MAWTVYQIILAATMTATGSINTISTAWADNQTAVGQDNGPPRPFDHPFFQAVGMFIGEFSCLLVFKLIVWRKKIKGIALSGPEKASFNPFIFLPPALCDMCGTSLMYLGLTLTSASSFQMLRGAIIVFTALLSVSFLGREIKRFQWFGILLVIAGLAVVGVVVVISDSDSQQDINGVIAGDLLVLIAQVIVAVQMTYEEKFIAKYNVAPLRAVGWEGFFGMIVLGTLLVPFYFIDAGDFSKDPNHRLENALDAFSQMGNNHIIIFATIGNIVSIAFFNFSGISVTKEISATTRMVLDSIRTLVVWIVSCSVQWEPFIPSQIAGFVLLVLGMFIYNDLIFTPLLRKRGILACCVGVEQDEEHSPLINDDAS